MSELDKLMVEAVALAIGRVIAQGAVLPVKNWYKAAEAAITTYESYKHSGMNFCCGCKNYYLGNSHDNCPAIYSYKHKDGEFPSAVLYEPSKTSE